MKKEETTLKSLDTKIDDVIRTIDDLAAATATGFLHMEKRFEQVDKKIESESARLDKKIESESARLDKKIESESMSVKAMISLGLRDIKDEIKRLDDRIDKLFKMTNEDVSVLIEDIEKIKLRVRKLELKNSHAS